MSEARVPYGTFGSNFSLAKPPFDIEISRVMLIKVPGRETAALSVSRGEISDKFYSG